MIFQRAGGTLRELGVQDETSFLELELEAAFREVIPVKEQTSSGLNLDITVVAEPERDARSAWGLG